MNRFKHTYHLLFYAIGIAATALMISCGDLFDFDATVSPYHMTFDRHEYYIMEGDTGDIVPLFDPDTISNMTIYWMSDNPAVASFADNRLIAMSQGETTVTGVSIEYQIFDTCHIYVMPRWDYIDTEGYAYDMVVYADVKYNNEPIQYWQTVGAFSEGELRGVGVQKTFNGISYMQFRIYSMFNPHEPYDSHSNPQNPLYPDDELKEPEVIKFRLYDHHTTQMIELNDSIIFDGESHGSLSELFLMNFSSNQ